MLPAGKGAETRRIPTVLTLVYSLKTHEKPLIKTLAFISDFSEVSHYILLFCECIMQPIEGLGVFPAVDPFS